MTNNTQSTYEQQPPIPEKYYVQKLTQPLSDGSNMILRIKYYNDDALTNKIDIYDNGVIAKTLKDDGVYPDIRARDFNYATYIHEDLSLFKNNMTALEAQLTSEGGVYHFEGHNGEFIAENKVPRFDFAGFNSFEQVQVYQPILDVTDCDQTILKQNSLFITDLSVVEDPARTYNVYDNTGNPQGAWTFGTLIKDMANYSTSGVHPKEFLREWVKTWLHDQSVGTNAINISYNDVLKREKAIDHLISPWMTKANTGSPLPTVDENNWEQIWNSLEETSLLENAPFKLMAIVNRIDLRGNSAYAGSLNNAGETRFIFTLINPNTGKPPFHDNVFGVYGPIPNGAIDWVGMNVIIEYGNPMKSKCDLQLFAKQWYDLSAFPLGTPGNPNNSFNDNLQNITDQVVTHGKGGTKNLNRSALDQLRTNEKIFQDLPAVVGADWDIPNWELRQFELGEDGYLLPAVVTNTPNDDDVRSGAPFISYNTAKNIRSASNYISGSNGLHNDNSIIDWIYGPNGNSINRIRTSMGMHNLPSNFLAGSAILYNEFTHHFGLKWGSFPNAAQNNKYVDMPDLMAKKIRYQLSLNTCQGCHGGENKTNFTQVFPRGYGEAANYWDPIPSYVTSSPFNPTIQGNGDKTSIDNRFSNILDNTGLTFDLTLNNSLSNVNFAEKTSNLTNQIVSPFLTGRRYSSTVGNLWQDDELNDDPLTGGEGIVGGFNVSTNKADDYLFGMYIVNDPSNESVSIPTSPWQFGLLPGQGGDYPQLHTQKWGHNDLQHRQDDLCAFIGAPCIIGLGTVLPSFPKSVTLATLQQINFMPLPLHSH